MSANSPIIFEGNIITSRVRVARNLWGYNFKLNPTQANQVIEKVEEALSAYDDFTLYRLKDLRVEQILALKERYLISQALIDNKENGAVFISKDKTVSIMVNEEDVIREQCFIKGLRIFEAYKRLDAIDRKLSHYFNFAFDEQFGFLTACPTNVGTGLRASVMLFLPALTLSGKIKKLCDGASKLGMTVRGAYGEGSQEEGYVYQISNEVTLGLSEQEILQNVEDLVTSICNEERQEIERMLKNNDITLMDKSRKSYGYLTNAILLTYPEFLAHVGNVKIGAMLGMINIDNIDQIDQLIIDVRPNVLAVEKGKLTKLNEQVLRAKKVNKTLESIKE